MSFLYVNINLLMLDTCWGSHFLHSIKEYFHLEEYLRNLPTTPKKLFNLQHASLRNTIERAFKVLKKMLPIIVNTTE